MRIVYLTMQWPSASETFGARDILALRGAGHDVSVVAIRPEPRNAEHLREAQATVSVPAFSFSFGAIFKGVALAMANAGVTCSFIREVLTRETSGRAKLRLLALIPSFFWCADKIKSLGPDMVHLFWGHYPSAVGYLLEKMNARFPVTMFLGAYDLEANVSLSRGMAERARAVFTHANANLAALSERGFPTGKIRVVHRGIDLEPMQAVEHANKDPHRVAFVGRLIPEKGGERVIEAFSSLLGKFPDASLDMIGDGPELGSLKARALSLGAADRIAFHGYLPPAEVYRKLYSAAILVLPSTSPGERLPNVIKEAMYAGAIPVTGKTPGIEELVENGRTGLVLENLSAAAIVDAITALWTHPSQDMQNAGKAKIQQDFDVKRNMKPYIDVWQGILKS